MNVTLLIYLLCLHHHITSRSSAAAFPRKLAQKEGASKGKRVLSIMARDQDLLRPGAGGGGYQSVEIHPNDDRPRVSIMQRGDRDGPSVWNRITGRGGSQAGLDGKPFIRASVALLVALLCFGIGLFIGNAHGRSTEQRLMSPFSPQVKTKSSSSSASSSLLSSLSYTRTGCLVSLHSLPYD